MRELIYKDEAYKAIDNCIRDGWDRISPSEAKMNIHHLVSDASEADRPQGEWIDAEIPLESGDTMPIQVCNLCKTFYPLVYTGGGHRFCPNCGARMLVKDINVPNKKGADDGRR